MTDYDELLKGNIDMKCYNRKKGNLINFKDDPSDIQKSYYMTMRPEFVTLVLINTFIQSRIDQSNNNNKYLYTAINQLLTIYMYNLISIRGN